MIDTNIKLLKFPKNHKSKEANEILKEAKDELDQIIIIGWDTSGNYYVNTNCKKNKEVLWLLETAKLDLMERAYSQEKK